MQEKQDKRRSRTNVNDKNPSLSNENQRKNNKKNLNGQNNLVDKFSLAEDDVSIIIY
jgi:hypothetical protein